MPGPNKSDIPLIIRSTIPNHIRATPLTNLAIILSIKSTPFANAITNVKGALIKPATMSLIMTNIPT